MAYSFWDGIADIFTGGAYSATKAVTHAASEAAGQVINAVVPSIGQGFHFSPPAAASPPPQGGLQLGGLVPGQPAGNISGTLTGSLSGTVSVPGSVTSINQKCCGYVIEGDYLLNTETGQVWLIDKQNHVLNPIRRNLLPIENAASALNLELVKQQMLEQKETELGKMHYSVRDSFSKKVDTLLGALDKEIDLKVKASK